MVLVFIGFLAQQSENSPYPKLQEVRLARDVLAVMGTDGVLGSGNRTRIEEELNRTLPINLQAHLRVSTYYREGSFNLMDIDEYGADIPGNTSIYEVGYLFPSFYEERATNYSVARMAVWERKQQ